MNQVTFRSSFFIHFVEAKKTSTGEALAQLFLSTLENIGIDIEKMRAQGYDGAVNMSGQHRGVQARVTRDCSAGHLCPLQGA